MTAIKIRGMAPAPQGKSRPLFLEVFCRTLIILCLVLSVVLSSMAVCDGHWLLADRRVFGLWYFCVKQVEGSGVPSNCSRHGGLAAAERLELGLGACRLVASLAVVSAIFGLELLVMSQVSEGQASSQRWHLGAWLVLLAAGWAAGSVATFVCLLWEYATPRGFTLTFWCQFTATFLFLLNGMAARHIQNMASALPSSGDFRKL
ncbi:voltage-dependent calcium channel gamma-like subunit [Electrophorus electricus]|uniref:Transmembrane protein 37 n=1 Tax=Electrophorus electricus TaxID=8005 RepID=A0A4W4HJX0_ELEEL|nr:voltage-dependent calcium channel gamma-like subunit [Electrophorus electricus]